MVSLILDNRIHGHIDQVNRLLERGDRLACYFAFVCFNIDSLTFKTLSTYLVMVGFFFFTINSSKGMKKYAAIDKWNTQLRSLYQTIGNRVC